MVDYRRMGIMDQHLGNAMPTTILQQPRNLWKSPRGTVLRIEALALLAIVLAFFGVAFGSCRRSSNRWIVQKGFLIANALSLSLGTYSIGLMQSSPAKSKMYPIWAVSLLTLFGCVDSVTVFNGLDYKSPLSKMLFQLCLYCGYVLLLSISTISTDVGNIAISVLSAITFTKGFHRSLSLVLPKRMRNMLDDLPLSDRDGLERFFIADPDLSDPQRKEIIVDYPLADEIPWITMDDIIISQEKDDLPSFRKVCFAFSLSRMLQRRFLGLSDIDYMKEQEYVEDIDGRRHYKCIDEGTHYKWTLKVVEVELAFLYETFFTSNAFLHYYEARISSFWAFTSFIGICFVGIVVAIPGALTRHQTTSPGPGTDIIIVETTTADLIVTLIILVSLALLPLVQLIRCWMSNWARVAFTCECARYWKSKMAKEEEEARPSPHIALESTTARNQKKGISRQNIWLWWMRLKGFIVSRTNWFDKYLWQNKLGQYSLVAKRASGDSASYSVNSIRSMGAYVHQKLACLVRMLGMQYIGEVLWDLWGSDSNKGAAIRLEDDVKASITDFLDKIVGCATDERWTSFLVHNGVELESLPYIDDRQSTTGASHYFTQKVQSWHFATCYCELEQEKQEERTGCMETAAATAGCFKAKAAAAGEKNRRVANALSKYCVYLIGSAPELLPGLGSTKRYLYNSVASEAKEILDGAKDMLALMQKGPPDGRTFTLTRDSASLAGFWGGVAMGKALLEDKTRCSDPWKVLALLWVQTLVYAAPYGEVQAHMQHLAQGGEFITHIWAMLYHSGIYKWEQKQTPPSRHLAQGGEFITHIVATDEESEDGGGQPDTEDIGATDEFVVTGFRVYIPDLNELPAKQVHLQDFQSVDGDDNDNAVDKDWIKMGVGPSHDAFMDDEIMEVRDGQAGI